LESANIQLSSVATDLLGASGKAMLEALLSGKADPEAFGGVSSGLIA